MKTESSSISFFERIGRFLLNPREQVRQSIHERRTMLEPILLAALVFGVIGALQSVAIISLASAFLPSLQGFLFTFSPELSNTVPQLFIAGSAIYAVVAILITGFIIAAITHGAARLLGGHGYYLESARVIFYSVLPYGIIAVPLIFSFVAPLAAIIIASGFGVIAFVWQVYILFESFKEVYGLDSGRTFVVLLAPIILIIIIAVISFAIAFTFASFNPGGVGHA